MRCIYCKTEDSDNFKGVEHLILQSFGTFSTETPTLKCVCDTCNTFFSKELDQVFARDSWEGVTRYKKGIKSREQRPVNRLKFILEETPEMGGFGGMVFEGIDSQTGRLIPPKGQFQIKNIKTGKFDVFFLEQIKDIKLEDDVYGIKGTKETRIYASSEEGHQKVIDEVKQIIPDFKIKETFRAPFVEGKNVDEQITLPIWIEGIVDHPVKRSLVKILMNFSAFYIGEDEVLKPEWNKAREYVRNNAKPLLGKVDNQPFWGDETETVRYTDDSFNIIVENSDKNIIGKIQVYNFSTYTFILAENASLAPEKEKAMRFTKGQKPFLAEKRFK